MAVVGRRRPDGTPVYELGPGDYQLYKGELWAVCPNGAGPICVPTSRWGVEWHGDGTATVDGSINVHPAPDSVGWHGFLERGVWRDA